MSRLQDLIVQFCPNGIPYKTLGKFASPRRGNG